MHFWVAGLSFVFIMSSFAHAERVLSEKEILARCYAQLTGQRLPLSDPMWGQATNQKGSGAAACVSLLSQVQLDANGLLTQPNNPVHRRVLKQFHDFHRDWFPQHWSYSNSFPDAYYGTVDIYDGAEPSMFITQSLFAAQAVPYANVLRGYRSLGAIRDSNSVTAEAHGGSGVLRATRAYVGDVGPDGDLPAGIFTAAAVSLQDGAGAFTSVGAPLLQIGQLIGIQTLGADTSTPIIWTKSFSPQAAVNAPGLMVPQNFHQSYGGGALGSAPYLMMHLGKDFNYVADGAVGLPRRAMMTAFNTFMCLSGPFSRSTDVTQFLANTADPNAAPFRRNVACLRCHATMDHAALTLRNLTLGSTGNIPAKLSRIPAMIVSWAADAGAAPQLWSPDPSPNFNRTLPVGRVFYRSFTGNLVDQTVQNLDGLGMVLSSTDDYYTCAASRYFTYFTGISVPLMDPYDPLNQSSISVMKPADKEYLNYVIGLGKELKATGSLKTLAQHIIKSDYYKLSGFGRQP